MLKKNIKTYLSEIMWQKEVLKNVQWGILCLLSVAVHICSIHKKGGGKDVISNC